MHNIDDDLNRREEEKRRLKVESQLYKKWRYGFLEDSILLDSKSDNEALAKINWLDKQVNLSINPLHFQNVIYCCYFVNHQIENQLEKEKLQKETEERQLRIQEESRKNDELLKARVNQRDEELRELKVFQEKHMAELKSREEESQALQEKEMQLKDRKLDINNELAKLEIHAVQRNERIMNPYNLRKIKMLLRDRSDAIRKDLKFDIELLERIASSNRSCEKLKLLREKFEIQYDMEIQRQAQIEAMYESEAKMALVKQQEIWLKESQTREKLLKNLLKEQIDEINETIAFIHTRQKELVDLRETHRQAIENANDRLRDFIRDQKDDECKFTVPLTGFADSFKERNLCDVLDKVNGNAESLKEIVQNGAQPINVDHIAPPQFGRKKVAWT